jgi:hypothetical protein
MTTQIQLLKTDNGTGRVEVVQINEGAQTVLGTLEHDQPMPVTLHSGQSFMLREVSGAGEDEPKEIPNGFGTATMGSTGSGAGTEVGGSNMSTGRTYR